MKSYKFTEIRVEAETKLENESRKLENLKQYVQESRNTTKHMIGVLSVMERRIKDIENKFLPILLVHDRLQTPHSNLECALAALDNYFVAQEVKSIVSAEPGLDEESQNKFLSSVQRLQNAQTYLKKHNPHHHEFANISSLFCFVCDSLNKLFRLSLLQLSRPMSLNELLAEDAAATDESLCDDKTTATSLNHFPSSLTVIADSLATQRNFDFVRVYVEARAATMMISYNKVRKQHPLGRKGRVNDVVLSNRCVGVGVAESHQDLVDRQEMESYVSRIMALQRLMENEQSLLTRIIPLQYHHEAFQFIIREALDSIVKDGKNITGRATRSIAYTGFGVVPVLLPVLRWLLSMRPKFNQIVEACEDNMRFQFTNTVESFRSTIEKALHYKITENVSSDPSPGLPKVHETTVSVLEFLEHLIKYTDIVADILMKNPAYNGSSLLQTPYNGKVDKNKVLLGMYIGNVLSELNLFFTLKSNDYTDKALGALFRLINCHHVLKVLSQSYMLELVSITQNNYLEKYSNLMKTYKKSYRQCWNRALSYIIDNDEIVITAGKLQDEDRNNVRVREKFCGFNKELEEVLSTQCKCLISDVELRAALIRDNHEHVLPKYQTFYNKFSNLKFAKQPEKVVKYTPKKVAAMLSQFFDIAETPV